MADVTHRLTVVVEGKTIDGWTDYEVKTSMIDTCATFQLRRPYERAVWDALPRDGRIRILLDGTCVLFGFIDRRSKRSSRADGSVIEIEGRDRSGRLVDESAPAISYHGLEMSVAIGRLVDPWFTKVTLSNARDRAIRRGVNAHKVPAGNEPIIVRASSQGGGREHPGKSRASVIEEIVAQAGLVAWGSADGREFFVGRPNKSQAPQYLLTHTAPGRDSSSTVLDMKIDEDNGDRYSLIAVVGAGGGTEQDFGIAVSSRRAYVVDNELNMNNGTGRDFKEPKRLLMPERDFNSIDEASRIAGLEQWRRDFRRKRYTATAKGHGQQRGPGGVTLFAIDTVARVIDEETGDDEDCLLFGVTFRGSRTGQTSALELVPKDTVITR